MFRSTSEPDPRNPGSTRGAYSRPTLQSVRMRQSCSVGTVPFGTQPHSVVSVVPHVAVIPNLTRSISTGSPDALVMGGSAASLLPDAHSAPTLRYSASKKFSSTSKTLSVRVAVTPTS